MKSNYNWKFCTVGGVTRVSIETGEDIAHLHELDQKMWTVLSCPTTGLEFDKKTLGYLDLDHDEKIRVNEVIATSQWITSVIKDPELLVKQSDSIALSDFNTDNADGLRLRNSAKQILDYLGKEGETISVSDTSDSTAIFAKTKFNGDGIITPQSTDDEALKGLISNIGNTEGTQTDRSGEQGINADIIEKFYADAQAFAAWQADADSRKAEVFPFGDKTADAFNAFTALDAKVRDFFMRCKLINFNDAATTALDVSVAKIETISGSDLSKCDGEIATYPIARPNGDGRLNLTNGINPTWKGSLNSFNALIGNRFANEITEDGWNEIAAAFAPYNAWMTAEAGSAVKGLGLDTVKKILSEDRKKDLLALIEQDNALKTEAEGIDAVDKMLHIYRDFYAFLKNFVTFKDFYSRKCESLAMFQAGRLFIDQRSCDLCVRVSDMSGHGDMAGLSGMFLIYCNCVSRVKNATMTIVAAMTEGNVENLREGKNAIFYDRDGQDWDAKVIKIVDNPISVKQAFLSPYRKFGNFINEQINKFAADKDSKVMSEATGKFSETTTTVAEQGAAAPKPAFDIAKFCGIFAAIGMALGYIGTVLLAAFTGFISLTWWEMIIALAAVILIISGPAMLLAWLKLRRRNLGPVLNANGWAINSKVLVNVRFGATLTSTAKYPKIKFVDPFAKKKMSTGKKIMWWSIAIIGAAVITLGILYLTKVPIPFIGQYIQ